MAAWIEVTHVGEVVYVVFRDVDTDAPIMTLSANERGNCVWRPHPSEQISGPIVGAMIHGGGYSLPTAETGVISKDTGQGVLTHSTFHEPKPAAQ